MFTPGAQMANKGVSSYEHHMGTPKRAHEGSQSSTPNSEKGANAGLGTHGHSVPGNYGGTSGHREM